MGKHFKLFEEMSEYDDFVLSDKFVLPNISYVRKAKGVKYHRKPTPPSVVTMTFNATTENLNILDNEIYNCKRAIIDGVPKEMEETEIALSKMSINTVASNIILDYNGVEGYASFPTTFCVATQPMSWELTPMNTMVDITNINYICELCYPTMEYVVFPISSTNGMFKVNKENNSVIIDTERFGAWQAGIGIGFVLCNKNEATGEVTLINTLQEVEAEVSSTIIEAIAENMPFQFDEDSTYLMFESIPSEYLFTSVNVSSWEIKCKDPDYVFTENNGIVIYINGDGMNIGMPITLDQAISMEFVEYNEANNAFYVGEEFRAEFAGQTMGFALCYLNEEAMSITLLDTVQTILSNGRSKDIEIDSSIIVPSNGFIDDCNSDLGIADLPEEYYLQKAIPVKCTVTPKDKNVNVTDLTGIIMIANGSGSTMSIMGSFESAMDKNLLTGIDETINSVVISAYEIEQIGVPTFCVVLYKKDETTGEITLYDTIESFLYISNNLLTFDTEGEHTVVLELINNEFKNFVSDTVTSVDFKGIKKIGSSAFADCDALASVTFDDTLTDIGANAFSECMSLTSLELPKSLKTIGTSAFWYCSGITGELIIPRNVTTIGENAFYCCRNVTSLSLSTSLKTIGTEAFESCYGLTEVTLPNSVNTLGDAVFSGCTGLTTFTFGNGITTTGKDTFRGCSSLVTVNFSDTIKTIGEGAFYQSAKMTHLVLPNNLQKIEALAFYNCNKITGITFPATLKEIGVSAFDACYELTGELTLPDSVESILDEAFNDCYGYSVLNVGSKLRNLSSTAFLNVSFDTINVSDNNTKYHSDENCLIETALNKIVLGSKTAVIPSYIKEIGDYAFYSIESFSGTLMLPQSITSIGDSAFSGCSSLTGELILPSGLKNIGKNAFNQCSGLTGTLVIPPLITDINTSAFAYCKFTSLVFHENIKTIGDSAFAYGKTTKGTLTLPNNLLSIGNSAFYECYITGDLVIPDSVTNIGDYAFANNTSIYTIYLGKNVSSIGIGAFNYGNYVTGITVSPENTILDSRNDCNGIIETATNKLICGVGTTIIPNTVTIIGDNAFNYCQNVPSQIVIPDTVIEICNYAFSNISSNSVVIGRNVQKIGIYAFTSGPYVLISLPMTAPSISSDTFYGCRENGTLYYYSGATGYDTWMIDDKYYLGYYKWSSSYISDDMLNPTTETNEVTE